jgi:hypothetical protein
MKRVVLLLAVVALAACAANRWRSTTVRDQFTEDVIKVVTIGLKSEMVTVNSNPDIAPQFFIDSQIYYPFIAVKKDVVYIGLRSAEGYHVPVGAVQIRIDDNPTWTIVPEETPVDFVLETPKLAGQNSRPQAGTMQSTTSILSPLTATTGDKAKNIIRQMIHGQVVRYRTLGTDKAVSTMGEGRIDDSFFKALKEIGIDADSL